MCGLSPPPTTPTPHAAAARVGDVLASVRRGGAPANGCYERHTDDHICSVVSSFALGESADGTSRGSRRSGAVLDEAKELAKRFADDAKAGLAQKKEAFAAEERAAAERAKLAAKRAAEEKKRAAEMMKKTKHMSRAQREKALKASQDRQAAMLAEAASSATEGSLESDPSGVEGALANINAVDSPKKVQPLGGSVDAPGSDASSVALDVTEAEGAADVIYVLSLADVLEDFAETTAGTDAASASMTDKPSAVTSALTSLLRADKTLLNAVLEIRSHKPVRAGWVSPSRPIADIQSGVGAAEGDSALSELWSDVTLLQVESDTPSLRPRPLKRSRRVSRDASPTPR